MLLILQAQAQQLVEHKQQELAAMKAALAARQMNWPLLATTGQCLLPRHRSSLHLCQLFCRPIPSS